MIDLDAIRKRNEALTAAAEMAAPCGDAEHEIEVAGEAYTNCCDRWLMRNQIAALILAAPQAKADIDALLAEVERLHMHGEHECPACGFDHIYAPREKVTVLGADIHGVTYGWTINDVTMVCGTCGSVNATCEHSEKWLPITRFAPHGGNKS